MIYTRRQGQPLCRASMSHKPNCRQINTVIRQLSKTISTSYFHTINSSRRQGWLLQKAHSINLKGVKLTWLIIIVISTCASCSCMVYPLIYGAINAHLSLWCRIKGAHNRGQNESLSLPGVSSQIKEKSGLKITLDLGTPRWEGSCLLFAWLLYRLLKPVCSMFPKPLKFGLQLTRGYSFSALPGSPLLRAVARLQTITIHITDETARANNERGKNPSLRCQKLKLLLSNAIWEGFSWTLINILFHMIINRSGH